jgi:transposase
MSDDHYHTSNPAQLPDDPALLKRLLVEQHMKHQELLQQRDTLIERIREEAASQLEAQRAQLEAEKRAEIAAILRRYYGRKSERFDPRQLLLFGEQVEQQAAQAQGAEEFDTEVELSSRKRKKKRHNHGRGPLPAHLPRIEIEHDLSDDEKPCPCCGELRHRIGTEVSEQLEYVPASFKVLKHIRHKYACRRCEQQAESPQIVTASAPPQPIAKGLPGPGLLAYLITSKWADHLPLYRMEQVFGRLNIHIPRSTMCGWLLATSQLAQPLVALMARRIRLSNVIHTDDTTVRVQAPGEGKCRTGRIWVYLGDRHHPYIVYDYTPDRKRDGPAAWLQNYQGFLQADAYGGYDGIYHNGAREVACWAHARRKFFDARTTDSQRATHLLSLVRELYALEDQAREWSDDERLQLRQLQSVPILTSIKAWLDEERPVVIPRSPMAEAFTYALNQWDALTTYTTKGYLNIDNNAAERALKRVAIGRKNWLFAGNDAAGQAAAGLYSLVASANRQGLDPQRYLTSVLAHLPSTPPADLHKLLPDNWQQADVEPPTNPSPD